MNLLEQNDGRDKKEDMAERGYTQGEAKPCHAAVTVAYALPGREGRKVENEGTGAQIIQLSTYERRQLDSVYRI